MPSMARPDGRSISFGYTARECVSIRDASPIIKHGELPDPSASATRTKAWSKACKIDSEIMIRG